MGIKGNPPFLNEKLGAAIVVEDSMWQYDDEEVVVNMQKLRKAETWDCACAGHGSIDAITKEEVQKKILLERF